MKVEFAFSIMEKAILTGTNARGEVRGLFIDEDGVKHASFRYFGGGQIKTVWVRETDLESLEKKSEDQA